MSDADFIAFVKFFLNLDSSIIDDTALQTILDMVSDQYPDINDCQKKYYYTVAVLRQLIRNDARGEAGQAGSGAVKKRTEKYDSTEISVEYDVGTTSSTATGWDAVLADLEEDPTTIGCTPFATSGTTSGVIIGGADVDPVTGAINSAYNRGVSFTTNRINSRYRFR